MERSTLRVLFVSHTYVVGVNQGKLNAIANTGKVEVGLLVPSNWKSLEWNRQFEVENPYPNIKLYQAPVLFSGRGGAHVYAPWKIWQVVQDFQPDLIQVEEEVFSLCALEFSIWSRLARKPLALFGWENLDRQLSRPRRWIRQFVMNTVQLMLPGNQDGAQLLRQWGYTGELEVIPQLGVDPKIFSSSKPEDRSSNSASNSTSNRLQIGFLGRFVPEKGIDTIFAAVRLLTQSGIDCQVTLCGSGSSEADLKQEAVRQQVDDRVSWQKAVSHDKVPAILRQFDVLVLPSRTIATWKEQFGHVLIEAMAMGVPVVGSNSGEIPNVIGRSDVVFPEGNAEALAAILERMSRDPHWRKQLEHYGIKRVHQLYTHERIAERLLERWQEVLNSERQREYFVH
jgi:glycosyltransferase involved in cell wall biosynthesis